MIGPVMSMPRNWLAVEKKGWTMTVVPKNWDQSSVGIGLRPRPPMVPKTAATAIDSVLIQLIQLKYEMPAGRGGSESVLARAG
jgi:hypothetical protein